MDPTLRRPGGAWQAVNYPEQLVDDLDAGKADTDLHPLDTELVLASAQRVAVWCWESRRTLVVSASGTDSSRDALPSTSRQRVVEWLAALGHQQFVLVPLGAGDQCLGYLALNRLGGRDWTQGEEAAALEVGRELGRVIGLARLRAREQELRQQLEELDAYKSSVVATLIHELKNPLAVVLGNLELARDEPELTDRAHEAIARGAARMQELVEDLLTLTRLREPVAELSRTTVDLSEIVSDAATIVVDQADLAGVSVDLGGVRPGLKVRGEQAELERLVLNLISNAVKFSIAGGRVEVALAATGTDVEFCCRDTGLGIPADDISSIFDEFYRSSNARTQDTPGTGLGLPIVRRIVQRHGGTIEVSSQLGQGSTFLVRLPLD